MAKKKKKEVKPYRDEDLCKWIQNRELHARDLLIRQNLKFIGKIAGSFAINPWIGLDRDDLVQVGSMAMVDAAKSYDPDRGAKFETFMTPVLKNAMTDLIREHQKGFEFRAIDPEGTLNYQMVHVEDEIPNRIHNAALQGFYCGYRAALSIIEQVKPLATMEHIGKILTTEYVLGYIKSYSEIEHLTYPC